MVVPPFYAAFSGPSGPSQPERMPAWKKLGLKLKNAKDTKEVISSTNGVSRSALKRSSPDTHVAPTAKGSVAEPLAKKRRVESDADIPSRGNSNVARTAGTCPNDPNARLKKRVSFTAGTKLEDGGKELITDWERDDFAYYEQKAAENDAKEAQKKVERSTVSVEKPAGTQGKSRDALDYLNLYSRSRSSWKFNKNREVWILRHILSADEIPASFNLVLASYVHGLGSWQARSRLLDQCQAALAKEVAKENAADRQDPDSSHGEDADQQKASHDDYVTRFKRSLEDHMDDEQRKAHKVDPEYQLWLSQRKRAEILLWAATPSMSSAEGASTSTRKVRPDPQSSTSVKAANGDSVNGVLPRGPLFKKKNRTVVVEASSSSEDGSASSDEDDDGGKLANRKGVPNGVTDSASSSDVSSGASSTADGDLDSEEESAAMASRSRGSVSPSEDGSETDPEFPSGERQQLAIPLSSGSNTSTLPVSSTPDETLSSASTDDDEEQDESDSGSNTATTKTQSNVNGAGETTSSSDGEDGSQSGSD